MPHEVYRVYQSQRTQDKLNPPTPTKHAMSVGTEMAGQKQVQVLS